jgi:hypothetical protein
LPVNARVPAGKGGFAGSAGRERHRAAYSQKEHHDGGVEEWSLREGATRGRPGRSAGNTAPQVLGDCTFAAAANWEQIVLGLHPDPTVIGFEFADAGGTEHGGLPQNSLWTYWQQHGIAGVRLTGLSRFYTDQTSVENAVRSYGALIAELRFVQNTGFAQYTVAAGGHDVVVDGFTPEGPLVVSWGQTLQMTWAQWNSEVVGMWGVAAS